MSANHLITHFEKTGLPLEVLDRPMSFGGGAGDVVQIDVARPDRRVRRERFRIFTGARDNRLQVAAADKKLRQLVLMVHEPRRRFETFISNWRWSQRSPPPNVVRKVQNGWFVSHFTDDRKRHFLAGMDEQHLFIAQLPRAVTSVWAAHVLLKPDEVRNAERGAFEDTLRQGEWFFVSLHPQDAVAVADAARGSIPRIHRQKGIAEAAGVRRGGRPHVADEVLVIDGRIFVRGSVRHPDHATVVLRSWRRAIVNTESFSQPEGIGFVD